MTLDLRTKQHAHLQLEDELMNCGTSAAHIRHICTVSDKLLTESMLPTLLSLGLIRGKQSITA